MLRQDKVAMPSKIKPEFVPLYTVSDSLDDSWELIKSQLQITEVNDLKGLIMNYHNSLVMEKDKQNESNN